MPYQQLLPGQGKIKREKRQTKPELFVARALRHVVFFVPFVMIAGPA
jgi:hypothetical protein